jgi:uncharacterized sulfatase
MSPLDRQARLLRRVGRLVLLACLCRLMPGPLSGAAGLPPRNVLLIMADDFREEGGPVPRGRLRTPHLDRLAAKGVRFERAYAQYPVCNPSRTSMLLGLRCEQTGIVGNDVFFRQVLPTAPTFPELLRGHGWTTRSYGKILHAANTSEAVRPEWLDQGRSWDLAEIRHAASPHRRGEFRNLSKGRLPWCEIGILDGDDDEQPDGQTAAAAIRSLRELHATGRPWLIAAGFHRPHDPFHAPRKYFDMHPPASLRLHADPSDVDPAPPLAIPEGWRQVFEGFSEDDRRDFLRAYLAGVSFMDAQVGRLLDTLDELRLWDRTLVVFLGDHGYHLGERGWWNKNTLFERSCRAPLIVADPDGLHGRACAVPVEFVDLFPTVAEFTGARPPVGLAGRSLRPLLRDVAASHKPSAATLVVRGGGRYGRSVTDGRWRLTRWSDGAAELYDHGSDPEETRNRADDPALAGRRRDLQALLDALPPWPKPKR